MTEVEGHRNSGRSLTRTQRSFRLINRGKKQNTKRSARQRKVKWSWIMQARSINAELRTYINVTSAPPNWSCSHLLNAEVEFLMEEMKTTIGRKSKHTTLNRPLRCSITIRLMMLWSRSTWPCSRTSRRSWKAPIYTSSKHSRRNHSICKLLSKSSTYNNSSKRTQTVFWASRITPPSKKSSSNKKRSKKLLIKRIRRRKRLLMRTELRRWLKAVRTSNQRSIMRKERHLLLEKSLTTARRAPVAAMVKMKKSRCKSRIHLDFS